MVRLINISILVLISVFTGFSQGQLDLYRGNQAYTEGNMPEAKGYYEQALSQNPNSFEGTYNLGSSNYKQQDFEQAIAQYQQAAAQTEDNQLRARALHNLGNAYLQGQQLEESIKAYKQALRLNPSDDETRYNLAYAMKLKKQQEQQQQQQEQNQDQQNQDQNQDQEKQDKQDKNEEKEEQEKNQDKNEEQEQDEQEEKQNEQGENEENEGDEEKEQQAQPKPMELTPREAEQMLDAARNEDQKIQMKLRKQKKAQNKNIDKDW